MSSESASSVWSKSVTSSSAPRLSLRQCQSDACARRVGSFFCCPAGSVVARSLSCRPSGAAEAAGRDFIGAWFSLSTEACPPDRRCGNTERIEHGRPDAASRRSVVIGVDAHKRTHTLVAADELGRELATQDRRRPPREGHLAALAWAGRWPERRWALEDCRHLTRTLEGDLLRAGEHVRSGPDAADGRPAPQRPRARQVRPDRRARGRPRGLARAGSADGPARRPRPRAAAAGRPPRRPRRRANPPAEPDPLAPARPFDPSCEIPPAGCAATRVVDDASPRSSPAATDWSRRSRASCSSASASSTARVNELERADHPARHPARAGAARHPRLRRADRRQDRRRSRRRAAASAPRAPSRAGTAPPRSRPAQATPPDSGSTAAATARSTPRCTRIAITQARTPDPRARLPRQAHPAAATRKTEALRLLRRRLSDVVYRTLLADEAAGPTPDRTPSLT